MADKNLKEPVEEHKIITPEQFFDATPEREAIIAGIIGGAGDGKSHFANTFPNPVTSDTEGRMHIVAKKFEQKNYIKHTPNMQTIRDTLTMMLTQLVPDRNDRYKWSWIMDSGSDWLQMAESEYLKEAKKEKVYPMVLWAQVYDKIDQVFDLIRKQGINCVITQQLKEEYAGEKKTGNWIAAGYKKFPYRVDVLIHMRKGIDYNGDTYYEDFRVGEILKDCWHSTEDRKPYLLDVTYQGIFNELKPYIHPGTKDAAILGVLQELEAKTGIPIEQAKTIQGK